MGKKNKKSSKAKRAPVGGNSNLNSHDATEQQNQDMVQSHIDEEQGMTGMTTTEPQGTESEASPASLEGGRFQVQDSSDQIIQEEEEDEYCDHEHFSNRAPWLRAMVLGANDGLVSVAALMMGVAAGNDDLHFLRLSGVAGLIAGALSMAVGEYVSVSSQRDAEKADIDKEIQEQLKGPEAQARELEELAQIYVSRGIPYHLAYQVAHHLTEKDVIRAHARDELGIDIDDMANPWQAAFVSFICFAAGAAIPFFAGAFLSAQWARITSILISTTAGLLVFGTLGAHLGGASMSKGAIRVVLGGWIALGISYGIGTAFNVGTA